MHEILKKSKLLCSCCGQYFMGIQHNQHDKGFGTCFECCEWSAKNWPYDKTHNDLFGTDFYYENKTKLWKEERKGKV